MIKDKIVFFGNSSSHHYDDAAFAIAGNQVQIEIIENIKKIFSSYHLKAYVYSPFKTWPFSKLIIHKKKVNHYVYHGYINLKFIKNLHISIKRFFFLLKYKPDLIFIYNINVIDSLFLNLFKILSNSKVILFIQDVHIKKNIISKIISKINFWLIKNLDLLIPITKNLIEDFKLPKNKTLLFNGGPTEFYRNVPKNMNLKPNIIFSGQLEKYNGLDKIVDFWNNNKLKYELHIYGKGSLQSKIIDISKKNTNIKYFGYVSHQEMAEIQSTSIANICLRFSTNLNENYFFPSKFFNFLSLPGHIIVNNFNNLPESVKNMCLVVNDDLDNLKILLNSINEKKINYQARINWLDHNASWNNIIMNIKNKIDLCE